MHYLFRNVALGLGLVAWHTPTARDTTDPRTLFLQEKTATGGDAWSHVAAIRLSGKIIAGDAPGTFKQLIDHRNGHNLLVVNMGGLLDESGFDGAIWDKQNGILTQADLPALVADAEAQAFINRDAWWSEPAVSRMKLLASPSAVTPAVDVIQVVPTKGSPIDVWLDRTTHLISQIVAHTDDGDQVTKYSDWRQVGGVKLPFRQVQTDAAGAVTTLEVDTVTAEQALAPAALARPAIESHGSIDGSKASSIPFRLTADGRGHIVIAATYNGKPSTLLFDSGAANYLVPESAKRFGLVTGGGLNIEGVGTGSVTGGFATVKEISIGPAHLESEAVVIGPLPYVAIHPRAGVIVDGLAGFEFLSEFRTTIDYAAKTLTFSKFGDAAKLAGVTVPYFSDGHSIYIRATVDGATGLFRLDTGDGGTLSVFRKFADDHGLFQKGGTPRLSAGGVGGTLPSHDFYNETFTLAGASFTGVPVSVSDTRSGAFASRSIAGNLGTGILSRFTITFDYRAHTMTFLPNERAHVPFVIDHTGISLTQKDSSALIVLSVRAGSPGEAAGLKAKDAIVVVNGLSVVDQGLGIYDLDPLRFGMNAFELTIRRGGRDVTLKVVPSEHG